MRFIAPNRFIRKPFVRAALRAAVTSLAALLPLRAQPADPVSPPRPPAVVLGPPTAAGQHLFHVHCAQCHGPQGQGGTGPSLAVSHLALAPTEEALIQIITHGVKGTAMPKSQLPPDEIKQVAAWVWHLGKIDPVKAPGDAAHGRELYFTRGNCIQCHSINGHGGAIGPDLTDIGRHRDAAYLRRALTDPAADVPKSYSAYRDDISLPNNFLLVRVATKDGRTITGVRINEDTFSIQLRDLHNQIHSFFKSELAELHEDWGRTPMPAYGATFTSSELDDLVAFLSSLRGPSR